jgi:hypothetical protein
MAFLRSNDQQHQRPVAIRVGFNALSIVSNCINGSLTACRCLQKVYAHGPPSTPGCFFSGNEGMLPSLCNCFSPAYLRRYRPINVLESHFLSPSRERFRARGSAPTQFDPLLR